MSGVIGVSVARGRLHAVVARRGAVQWAAAADYSSLADLRDALAQLMVDKPDGIRRAHFAIGSPEAQLRILDDTASLGSADLRRSIVLAPQRLLLKSGSPLVIDAEGGRSAVVIATPEPLVQTLIDGAMDAGLEPEAVTHASIWLLRAQRAAQKLTDTVDAEYLSACAAAIAAPPRLTLFPPTHSRARRTREIRSLRRIAVACVVGCLIAAGAYVGALIRQERAARQALLQLQPSLVAAEQAQHDLDQARTAIEFLQQGGGARSHSLSLLSLVTRALPDADYLTSLHIDSIGSAALSGFAGRAASIPSLIEKLGGGKAALEGVTTREVSNGVELDRFVVLITPSPNRP